MLTLPTRTELIASFASLPPDLLAEADRLLAAMEAETPIWVPQAGKQTEAYYCDADELFYGGGGGGGKSDLLLGLAGTAHRRSIIFRRIFPSVRGLIERSREIFNQRGASHAADSYNESLHLWRLGDGRIIEFGSLQLERDKEHHRGLPRDLYGWDEVTEFTESQFRFVNGWNRSTIPGQRCRVVATGNPPSSDSGQWVIEYWAPWLKPGHPHPAEPGELRWFARIDDADVEVPDATPIEHNGELIYPRSRTFIPALLSDNPLLEATGYRAILQSFPEPLRSQMLYGDFKIGTVDNPWQVIPTPWVRAAQARWVPTRPRLADGALAPLDTLGVDVARGGKDRTVLAPRYGSWIGPLQEHAGITTPDGNAVTALIVGAVEPATAVHLDLIGVGSSPYDQTRDALGSDRVVGVNFGEGTDARTANGRLGFANVRAWAYWTLRELLHPDNPDPISLPPGDGLLADLTAPRYSVALNKILVESKKDIIKRVGRSPDEGDAVVLTVLPTPRVESGVVQPGVLAHLEEW
jgi:hypothetical protein